MSSQTSSPSPSSLSSSQSSTSSSSSSSNDPTYTGLSSKATNLRPKKKILPTQKQQPTKRPMSEKNTISSSESFKLDENTGALVLVSAKNTKASSSSMPTSQSLSKVIRQLVWNKYIGERNGLGTCWCCRNKTISAFEFEAGHVVPRAKGGPDTVENLRPICSLCNKSMGTENMLDYQKRQNLGPSPSQVAWEWICSVVSIVPLRFGW